MCCLHDIDANDAPTEQMSAWYNDRGTSCDLSASKHSHLAAWYAVCWNAYSRFTIRPYSFSFILYYLSDNRSSRQLL